MSYVTQHTEQILQKGEVRINFAFDLIFRGYLKTSFLVIIPNSLPLCVTRVCLSPNFLNMSTTVSIGVWKNC